MLTASERRLIRLCCPITATVTTTIAVAVGSTAMSAAFKAVGTSRANWAAIAAIAAAFAARIAFDGGSAAIFNGCDEG